MATGAMPWPCRTWPVPSPAVLEVKTTPRRPGSSPAPFPPALPVPFLSSSRDRALHRRRCRARRRRSRDGSVDRSAQSSPPHSPLASGASNRAGDAPVDAGVRDIVRPCRHSPGPIPASPSFPRLRRPFPDIPGEADVPFAFSCAPFPLSRRRLAGVTADSPPAQRTRSDPGMSDLGPDGSGWCPAWAQLGPARGRPLRPLPRPAASLGRPKAGPLGLVPGLQPGLAGLEAGLPGFWFFFLELNYM